MPGRKNKTPPRKAPLRKTVSPARKKKTVLDRPACGKCGEGSITFDCYKNRFRCLSCGGSFLLGKLNVSSIVKPEKKTECVVKAPQKPKSGYNSVLLDMSAFSYRQDFELVSMSSC